MGRFNGNDSVPLKRPRLFFEACTPAYGTPFLSTTSWGRGMARALPAAAMNDGDEAGAMVCPNSLIKRVELIRIITQSLYSLGYTKAATLLEEESGVPLQSQVISDFMQQISDGKWDDSLITLRNMGVLDPKSFGAAASLILEHKFFEQLIHADVLGALMTLRKEISPLQVKKEKLHDLASCIVCPSKLNSIWNSGGTISRRSQLLEDIQAFLPPSLMIPERRLEHILEQALSVQKKACIFHNSVEQPLSLYVDHNCGRDQIPSQTFQVLEDHSNEVWFLQFSHNGKYLGSASKDCTAIVWEVVGDNFVKLKCRLTGHQKPLSFMAWSPDDRMILTCGNIEVIKLWDVETGECKRTFDKPNNSFSSCAWFPDGKRFISGCGDRCIYMWNIEGKELDSWKGQRMPRITDLTVSADGKNMISICEKDIRIYNLENKSERVINEEKAVTSLSISNDGRLILVNLASQEIHLWDITDNFKLLFKYWGHQQTRYVIRSCFGGFNQVFVVSGSEDSQVYIWHRDNGELLEALSGHSGTVNSVSWNPVNPHMFASASDDHTIRIWGLKKYPHVRKDGRMSNGNVHVANGDVSLLYSHS